MVLAYLKLQRFLQMTTSIFLNRNLRICRLVKNKYSNNSKKLKLNSSNNYRRPARSCSLA